MQQLFQTINAGLRYLEKNINEMSSMIILDFCLEAVFKFHCRKRNIKSSIPLGLRRKRLDFRKDKAARNGGTKYHRGQKYGEKNCRNMKMDSLESLSKYYSVHTLDKT